MTTLTITAKGQITLNRNLLRRMGVGPGDKLDVEMGVGGELSVRPARREGGRTIESLFGSLNRPGQRPMSIEEMDEAIGRSRVEDDERITREWYAGR